MEPNGTESRIVDALRHALEADGFGGLRLAALASTAGLDLASLYRLTPTPAAALRLAFRQIDALVLAAGSAEDSEQPRDRLFEIMMRRYDALVPWRAALRKMARGFPPDPILGVSLALAVESSMGAMLEAAGISSLGLPGAVRVRGLALIHADVLRRFLNDDSADLAATMKALDHRLRQAERAARWFGRVDQLRRSAAQEQGSPSDRESAAAPRNTPEIMH